MPHADTRETVVLQTTPQSTARPSQPEEGGGSSYSVAGLFAGIGGLELGLHDAGAQTELLCEVWEPAINVLSKRFPDTPIVSDIRDLKELPAVDVVCAGFPCTDLSQAGRTAGIHGSQSGLVTHLFRLLRKTEPRWVVIENVRNMLVLDQGRAMAFLVRELEDLGFRWAYRLVDSRFTGVPQRRQRVMMVASRDEDPRGVLFADDAGEPQDDLLSDEAFGFYWTEGLRGLGWAQDAVPTLKGGSALGIPSPPAIWIRSAEPQSAMVTPGLSTGELLQGFPQGWTDYASQDRRTDGHRWKLIGNAVTVGVARWLGKRLATPGIVDNSVSQLEHVKENRWPTAAWGERGQRWIVNISMWPKHEPYQHLLDVVDLADTRPLSRRAAEGFFGRMERSTLRFDESFKLAMKQYVELLRVKT